MTALLDHARQLPVRALRFARTPRARKIALWFAGIMAAIGAIGFFVVPPLVKGKVETELSKALHRPVTIEKLGFNPYVLSLTVRGFTLKEPAGDAPAITFDELYVNLSSFSIFRLAPVLDAVRLVKPHIRIVRNADKTYNYQDLIDEILAKPSGGPTPPFSLNNIEVVDGRIDFDDRPEKLTHSITDLDLGIPFISSLPYYTDLKVQPRLTAKLNGNAVGLTGETKPFKDTRETTLRLDLDGLQLSKYFDYSPVPLKFKLPSGALDTRLVLMVSTRKEQISTLAVSGTAAIRDLAVQFPDGKPAIVWKSLAIELDKVDAIARNAAVKSVRLEAPEVDVTRRKDGAISLLALLPTPGAKPAPRPAQPFGFTVGEIDLSGGRIRIADLVPERPFHTTVQDLAVNVKNLSNAPDTKADVTLALATERKESIKLTSKVQLAPLAVEGRIEVAGLRLKELYPYYESVLNLEVADGTLDLDTGLAISLPDGKLDAKLTALNATINALKTQFPGDKEPFGRVPAIEVRNTTVDLAARLVSMQEFNVRQPVGVVVREPDGSLRFARLIKRATEQEANAQAQAPGTDSGPPWVVEAKRYQLVDGAITIDDRSLATPARIELSKLNMTIDNFTTAPGKKQTVALRTLVNTTGKVAVNGSMVSGPQSLRLKVEVKDLPLAPFQPYIAKQAAVVLTGGAFNTAGQLEVDLPANAAPAVRYAGEITVADFASLDKTTSQDLLKWRSLFLGGIKFDLAPLAVNIDEIALSDFYSRLIVNADGTLNLQQVVKKDGGKPPPPAGDKNIADAAIATVRPDAASVKTADPGPTANLRVGRITLQGGNINFTDNFIKPNYSANLTGVGGAVSEMTPDKAADVELRGRIDNTAPLEVLGRINPLGKDLFLDIKASARDIELSPFTPYAVKYAGYGIQKGKLSVNIKYFIENRKLNAENNIYLDQLTFGDKIDSPTATKLPVLFAVSLLKDRNGVIDINLPISGSLDDPQFSIGGVIVRVIVNLFVKAVTSPFALIGAMFGGSEELAYIEFAPGTARLDAAGDAKTKTLIKALTDRPALKVDVTGRVDPAADREGLKRAAMDRQVRAQKLQDLTKAGKAPASAEDVRVDAAEYPKYLTAAYSDAKFPKPRNLVGIAKDLPVAEMEQLMLTNAAVTEDDLRALANARAQAVKDALVVAGKMPADRVFMVAPKLTAEDIKDKGKSTRVDFSLR